MTSLAQNAVGRERARHRRHHDRGMPSACASSQACSPPAPPKATSVKSRGSWPRSMETTRSARSMLAFTTRTTPSANCSSVSRDLCLPAIAREPASRVRRSSANSPPRKRSACKRPSSRLASVTVGCVPLPVADRTGIGAGRFRPDAQRAAGIEARQGAAASAHGVDVEHGNAHRQSGNLAFIGGLRIAAHQCDVGRGASHVEADNALAAAAPRHRRSAHHAARRAGQHRAHRLMRRPIPARLCLRWTA